MASGGKRGEAKPLYRRVNTRTHGVHHGAGGEARWSRNAKSGRSIQDVRGSMRQGLRHGLDYTPLFRFLLSRVGQPFDATFGEAVARLDREDPIWWLVARSETDRQDVVRVGESSYYSGLFVDDDGALQKVSPQTDETTLEPGCACCTHSFNGVRFTRAFAGD